MNKALSSISGQGGGGGGGGGHRAKDVNYREGFRRRHEASDRDRKDRRRFDIALHREMHRTTSTTAATATTSTNANTTTTAGLGFGAFLSDNSNSAAHPPFAGDAGGGIEVDTQASFSGLAAGLATRSVPDISHHLGDIKMITPQMFADVKDSIDGLVDALFQIVKSQNMDLMKDALYIISNLSSLSHDKIQPIIAETPTLNAFLEGYLSGQFENMFIVECTISILGNIASDCKYCRSSLYEHGSLPLILRCMLESMTRNADKNETHAQDEGDNSLRIAVSAGFAVWNLAKDPRISYEILTSDIAVGSILELLKTAPDPVKTECVWILSQLAARELDRAGSLVDKSSAVATSPPTSRLPTITTMFRGCIETLAAYKVIYTSDNSDELNKITKPLWKTVASLMDSMLSNPMPSDVEDLVYLVPLVTDYMTACVLSGKSQDLLKECIWTYSGICIFLSSVNSSGLKDSFSPVAALISADVGTLSRLPTEVLPIIHEQLLRGKFALKKESLFALGAIVNLGIFPREMFSAEVILEFQKFLSFDIQDVDLYIQMLTIIKQTILIDPAMRQVYSPPASDISEYVDNLQSTCSHPYVQQLCEEITIVLYAYMESLDGLGDFDNDDEGESLSIEVGASAFSSSGGKDGSTSVFSFGGGAPSSLKFDGF